MRKKKKGVSPVIATVLLVAMVVVIGLIIFMWFKGVTEEAVTKFGGTNIKLVCEDVEFLSDYSSSTRMLSISNIGNVPLYGIRARVSGEGSYQTLDIRNDLSVDWPEIGLRQGDVFSGMVSEFSGANQVILIPVLMGTSEKGNQIYVCEERFGQEVMV